MIIQFKWNKEANGSPTRGTCKYEENSDTKTHKHSARESILFRQQARHLD